MTTNEKLVWITGVIAAVGLIIYSAVLLTATSIDGPKVWLATAICVAIGVAYRAIMRGHTPETDQQDAWAIGEAYRGWRASRQTLIPIFGVALSILLQHAGFFALAHATFVGVLAAMLLLSMTELLYFRRQHVAPGIGPAEIRGTIR